MCLKVYEFIEKWCIQGFLYKESFSSNIFKDIAHIDFENLILLDLDNNLINNIEAFTWFSAPKLEYLFLEGNCIRSLKPLAKLNSKCLKKASFLMNEFQNEQANFFNRMKLNNCRLKRLSVSNDDFD